MALTKQAIEKLAALARIELTEEEKKKFSKQISSILDYAKQVQEVDTAQVANPSHLLPQQKFFRRDVKKEFSHIKKIIDQFPEKSGNLNKVKAVLE